MPDLDPVSIQQLAEWIDSGELLDMRVVDHGLCERVRVVALIVRRDSEDVELHQDSSSGEGVRLRVPSDNIWWARPTMFGPTDEVRPIRIRAVIPDVVDTAEIVSAACQAVAENGNFDIHGFEQLFNSPPVSTAGRAITPERYKVLWVLYEITDLDPKAVCVACGYKSQMPWNTARNTYTVYDNKTYQYAAKPEYKSLFRQLVARTRQIGGKEWAASEPRFCSVL